MKNLKMLLLSLFISLTIVSCDNIQKNIEDKVNKKIDEQIEKVDTLIKKNLDKPIKKVDTLIQKSKKIIKKEIIEKK